MPAQKRINFSIVRIDGYYRVRCDETLELISGKISSRKKAQIILRENVGTESFLKASIVWSKDEIARRMKLFAGRLRPKGKPWTIEEARLVASTYDSRGKFYNYNRNAYSAVYQKGWLNDVCAHMKLSNKKNKYVFGVLNPNAALAKIFDYKCHLDFCKGNQGAYDALRRFGVDTLELFDNRDSAEYLRMIIVKLADDAAVRLVQ